MDDIVVVEFLYAAYHIDCGGVQDTFKSWKLCKTCLEFRTANQTFVGDFFSVSPDICSEISNLLVPYFSGGSILLPEEFFVEENVDLINEKNFLTRFCYCTFDPIHESVPPIFVID